jgi:DNA-binding CsgD family transcriptional regulator/tetratricopeptide (TPR) repeat protein
VSRHAAKAALAEGRAAYDDDGDFERARIAVDAALARGANHPDLLAEALVADAQLRAWDGDSLSFSRRAHKAAVAAEIPLARAELVLGIALYMRGRSDAAGHLERARRLATAQGDARLRVEAGELLSNALQAIRRAEDAIAVAEEVHQEAVRAALPMQASRAEWLRARLMMYGRGDYSAILDVGPRLLGKAIGLPKDSLVGDLALALADTGDEARAERLLDDAARETHTAWGRARLLFSRAQIALVYGRAARAAAIGAEAFDAAPSDFEPHAALARDWALHGLGVRPGPPSLHKPLPVIDGVTPERSGLEAYAAGDLAEAERRLRRAARRWAGQSVRDELRCLAAVGVISQARGRGDALLEDAERRATEHGVVPLASALQRLLRGAPKPRARPILSAREEDVMHLIAAGATSRETGERLGISTATVESHVRKAMAKLGARTRAQAAAMVVPRSRRRSGISEHEQHVLDLLAQGASVTEAARLLYLSRRTLTRQLAELRARLGAGSNAELLS